MLSLFFYYNFAFNVPKMRMGMVKGSRIYHTVYVPVINIYHFLSLKSPTHLILYFCIWEGEQMMHTYLLRFLCKCPHYNNKKKFLQTSMPQRNSLQNICVYLEIIQNARSELYLNTFFSNASNFFTTTLWVVFIPIYLYNFVVLIIFLSNGR